MINLRYSNRMELLLDSLAEAVRRERQEAGPWKTIRLVVPNQATARRIEVRMVASEGIAANLKFDFLDAFLRQFLPPERNLLDRVAIQGILLRQFSGPGLDGEALAPVRAYLGLPADPQRIAQLAYRIAGLLEEYLYSRPGWAEVWEAGGAVLGDEGLEPCQRALWQLVRRELPAAAWVTPRKAAEFLAVPDGFGPVHLFGMTHLAPGYQIMLDRLGRLAPGRLTFYALNPCQEFWDDLQTGAKADREALRAARRLELELDGTDPAAPEWDADPYRLQQPGESDLLRRWGRAGREKIRLLNELSDWDFDGTFEDPGAGTLLAALQQDILFRRPSGLAAAGPSLEDGSIQVHTCPNPRREAETICELIWDVLRHPADGAAPIRFDEVAVMVAPADLDAYAAHLEAAFGGETPLPLTVLNQQTPALAQALEAFGMLLRLAESPFSRAEMLAFLFHPAVRRRLGEEDVEAWSAWCQETGIIRGKDREDMGPAYFREDLFTWDQGHRRLALGAFLSRDGEAFACDGDRFAPQETGSGSWDAAAAFILDTRALLEDLRRLRGEQRELAGWARRFCNLASAWIGGSEKEDRAAVGRLRDALMRLAELEPAAGSHAALAFGTARTLARQELERLEAGHGGGRSQGVLLGDPQSLRGLPFRVVICAGMGEGRFPGREAADDLDLRLRRRLPGDVPAPERDRYLFLEALLSARERLILTYVCRHPLTGETLQPSPVVAELCQAAAATCRAGDFKPSNHRLLRWDPERFAGPAPLLPAQASVYLEARAEQRHRRRPAGEAEPGPDPALEPNPVLPAAPPYPPVLTLSLHHLRKFLESPLQGHAAALLGLREEGEDPERLEEEAATTEALLAVPLLRDTFWIARQGLRDRSEVYDRLRRGLESAGTAPPGLLAEPERVRHGNVLQAWDTQVPVEAAVRFPRLGLAPAHKSDLPRQGRDPVQVDVATADGKVVTVELVGDLSPSADLGMGEGSVLLLNGKAARPQSKAKDLLRAWIDHLVTAAATAGETAHTGYLVWGEPGRGGVGVVPFEPMDQGAAMGILAGLLGDLLNGRHDHLLPIEAVADPAVNDGYPPGEWIQDKLQDKEHGTFQCLYGPVTHPETYPAADLEALEARRLLLQPFLQALGIRV